VLSSIVRCPRKWCGGALEDDHNEKAVLVCIACGRRFTRMLGELFELKARPATKEDRRYRLRGDDWR
jgi:hypothetical protein